MHIEEDIVRKDEGFIAQLYFCCGCGKPLLPRDVDLLAIHRAINSGEKLACSVECALGQQKAFIFMQWRQ